MSITCLSIVRFKCLNETVLTWQNPLLIIDLQELPMCWNLYYDRIWKHIREGDPFFADEEQSENTTPLGV